MVSKIQFGSVEFRFISVALGEIKSRTFEIIRGGKTHVREMGGGTLFRPNPEFIITFNC